MLSYHSSASAPSIDRLLLTLLCVLGIAVAHPRFSNARVELTKRVNSNANATTNAARLQVGLPLLKPRRFFNPTRVGGEQSYSRSIPVH